MAEIAGSPAAHEVDEVEQGRDRSEQEVGEARVLRAHEAPDDPQQHEAADEVARPDVQGEGPVLGQVGDGEGQRQGPVEDADDEIPDEDGALLAHGSGQHRGHPIPPSRLQDPGEPVMEHGRACEVPWTG